MVGFHHTVAKHRFQRTPPDPHILKPMGTNLALQGLITESGFSYSGLAHRINALSGTTRYDQASVSRWIRLGQTPRHPAPAIIAAILSGALGRNVSLSQIGMISGSRNEAGSGRSLAHTVQLQPPWDNPTEETSTMQMNRRALMYVAMGTLAVSAASAQAGADADPHRATLRQLIEAEDLLGSQAVAPLVLEQLSQLDQLRVSGRANREILSVHAETAELMAWIAQDQRDWVTAAFWSDRGLHLAHAAGGGPIVAHLLCRKAHIAGDAGLGTEAIGLAGAALDNAHGTQLVAVALTHQAHGYALTGDFSAADRMYSRAAEEALPAARLDAAWGGWVDSAYVAANRARSLTHAGEWHNAAATFDLATNRIAPHFPRDRGVYLSRSALSHARAGDIDKAAQIGVDAVHVGARTASARIHHGLSRLASTLSRHSKQKEAGAFLEAFASTRSAAA